MNQHTFIIPICSPGFRDIRDEVKMSRIRIKILKKNLETRKTSRLATTAMNFANFKLVDRRNFSNALPGRETNRKIITLLNF